MRYWKGVGGVGKYLRLGCLVVLFASVQDPVQELMECYQREFLVNFPLCHVKASIVARHIMFTTKYDKSSKNKTKLRIIGLLLLRITGLVASGFPSQRASNAESIPTPWYHHGCQISLLPWRSLVTCQPKTGRQKQTVAVWWFIHICVPEQFAGCNTCTCSVVNQRQLLWL